MRIMRNIILGNVTDRFFTNPLFPDLTKKIFWTEGRSLCLLYRCIHSFNARAISSNTLSFCLRLIWGMWLSDLAIQRFPLTVHHADKLQAS